jgi:hypothetical protein
MKQCGAFILLVVAGCAVGCVTSPSKDDLSEPGVAARWFAWLQEGRTTRQELVSHLGPPTTSYENGRITTYRMFLSNPKKKVSSVWSRTDYRQNFGKLDQTTQLLVARSGVSEEFELRAALAPATYGLVLVFDERNLLKTQSLRRTSSE